MRVLIYGAGAVGCCLGGHLALAGHDVTLLGRPGLADAIGREGLRLQSGGQYQSVRSVQAVSSAEAAVSGGAVYDWIAFTMKAYDTVPAIFELQSCLGQPPPIISFQNGLGNEESLRDAFGPDRVASGTLTTAVSMPEPGLVVEERRRGLAIAADSPHAAAIMSAFSTTDLQPQPVPSTESLKWSKLLLNIMGNATAAILDLSPREMYRDRRLFAVECGALVEALALMDWLHIPVIDLPGAPVRGLAFAIRHLPPFLSRLLLARRIAAGRGNKMPSLQAALRAGQRKTEVAWLNGAVAQAADRLERIAPINHALALIVSDIAAGRSPWDMYRHRPDMLLAAIRATR